MSISDRLASVSGPMAPHIATVTPVPAAPSDAVATVKARVTEELFKRIGSRINDSSLTEAALHDIVREELISIIDDEQLMLTLDERNRLIQDIEDDALGLGPLQRLLQDSAVSEIMVNGFDRIYVERHGKIELSSSRFASEPHLRRAIERIVSKVGRRIDESSPMVDARLSDGSRVNAVVPPLAVKGSSLTIRKFSETPLTAEDLVGFGSMTPQIADLLRAAVEARLNILVSGGTGTGKTTLLNVLSSFIPTGERIVTIEDAIELNLQQDHVVQLESRPPNIEGSGEISIRDLVRNSLRMRPDRIVVGECRSGEALDMLQAMNTGHDGSISTLHSNSPRDCIARLETLVLMAGMDLPLRAIREQVASAVDLIVQIQRLRDGTRRITHVTEVIGMEGDVVTLQDAFVFDFA
ncbi:MAG: CpaF family protein, partial [Aeromicrobium sp.]